MTETLLVPQPKSVNFTAGSFEMSAHDRDLINSFIIGAELPECISTVSFAADESVGIKGRYSLDVSPEEIIITSDDDTGIYYGVQTLKQLLKQQNSRITCCSIEDSPDFPVRGVLIDISRDRVPTMASVKYLIDLFSEWKYNQFQLYTEHTFAYSKHRAVWEDASPFTPDEIRTLNTYCAERGIELVPNQNSFGHMERWFMHDEYKYLAESPDGFNDPWGIFREHSSTLAPAVPETLGFLSELYDELLPCFDSDVLNVGGDEPYELGHGRSKEICESRGLEYVYLEFLLRLHQLAAEKGKRIQIYGDIIMKYPHLIKELPKDLILVNWGYEAEHPFASECEQIAASGIPFYVCTGVSSWNSIGGRWSNTKQNIINGAENGLRSGAEGYIVSEWGDNGHLQQITAGLPGFLFGACAAWNVAGLDGFDIKEATAEHIFDGDKLLAEASAKIQDVWACSKVALHNVSLPAVIMLDPRYPYYREDFKQFRDYRFTEELLLLDQADALLDKAPESLFRDELLFSSALLRHGCRLGALQLATPELTVNGIAAADRQVLAAELEPLISEYERLWIERSRPGGLENSRRRLSDLLDLYRM